MNQHRATMLTLSALPWCGPPKRFFIWSIGPINGGEGVASTLSGAWEEAENLTFQLVLLLQLSFLQWFIKFIFWLERLIWQDSGVPPITASSSRCVQCFAYVYFLVDVYLLFFLLSLLRSLLIFAGGQGVVGEGRMVEGRGGRESREVVPWEGRILIL